MFKTHGGVFKICDEQESPNERACLGGGGGLRHPPNPPPLFEAVQGCLKAPGLKFWPIMRALCLQMGGLPPPPQPPRCFKPRKLASKHVSDVSVFGSYHASILFAKGGWAAPLF